MAEKKQRKTYSEEYKTKIMLENTLYGKSLKELSVEHKIPKATIDSWSSKGNWKILSLSNKKDRNEAVMVFTCEQVERYEIILSKLDKDIKKDIIVGKDGKKYTRFESLDMKDRKIFIECMKMINDMMIQNLMLGGK